MGRKEEKWKKAERAETLSFVQWLKIFQDGGGDKSWFLSEVAFTQNCIH